MRRLPVALLAALAGSLQLLPVSANGAVTETVVYSFCSQQPDCADGTNPVAGLLRIKDELYATASNLYFTYEGGTVVALNTGTGTARVVYSFGGNDGYSPESAPIEVSGTLYGMAAEGGDGFDGGTIYSLNPKKGKGKLLYSFCGNQNCPDGAFPVSTLLELNGLLYGTTDLGGSGSCEGGEPGCGTVFTFDLSTGAEKVLHAFCNKGSCQHGSRPWGGVIELNGVLYGTTSYGGGGAGCDDTGLGCGVVYSLDPNTGAETVLHTFAGASQDGGTPLAGLIDVNGMLYGTTEHGGSNSPCDTWDGCGTVFSIDPVSGAETILHVFQNDGKDGENPVAPLIQVKGKLYGTTVNGGAYGYGTVFELDLTTGKETVLYSFCSEQNCTDGSRPYAGLIDVRGILYGTTFQGGANGYGTVFSLTH